MFRRLASIVLALALASCGVTMKESDIPGVYRAARGISSETLTLNADGTYVHEWDISGQDGQSYGSWRIHMLGYGFAQIVVNNYQDKIDPDAEPGPDDWNTDVKRTAPWDRQRILINQGLRLEYVKERVG
ncbi:MAG: hypothetical protein ABUS48_02960 [Pseudomonadota bacterium]